MAISREAKFPLGEKAHLPQGALGAVQFVPENESNILKLIWEPKGKGGQMSKDRGRKGKSPSRGAEEGSREIEPSSSCSYDE